MTMNDREQQIAQAEEILGDRLEQIGFVKGLFFGQVNAEQLPDYPDLQPDDQTRSLIGQLRELCHETIDPSAIDQASRTRNRTLSSRSGRSYRRTRTANPRRNARSARIAKPRRSQR